MVLLIFKVSLLFMGLSLALAKPLGGEGKTVNKEVAWKQLDNNDKYVEDLYELLEKMVAEKEKEVDDDDVDEINDEAYMYKNGDYFEGDLAISKELIDAYYETYYEEQTTIDTTTVHDFKRWPNNVVPYTFNRKVKDQTRRTVRAAMVLWEEETCLQFEEWTGTGGYLNIRDDKRRCFATSVGYKGPKRHTININQKCYMGEALHEIGHILGYWHEQSRPDRDDYVKVLWENIVEKKKPNYRKLRSSIVDTRGVGYDYASIMHYGKNAFSKNGQPVMEVSNTEEYERQESPVLGRVKRGLSERDIEGINRLYNCTT